MADLDTPMALPASPIPPYLIVVTHLFFGLSAITRSKVLSTIGIAYGLYWMLELVIHPPSGHYLQVYLAGTTFFGIVAKLFNSTFFRDPNDFTRIKKVKDDGTERPRTTIQTAWDVIEVGFFAGRGIGWNFQIRIDVPRASPTYPRGRFVLERLCDAAFHLTLVDMASFYLRNYTPLGTLPVTQDIASQPLYQALPQAWAIYCSGRWSLLGYYNIVSAISVASTIYSPYDCPPLFGSWTKAYTIRNFWAHTWHQMMRLTAQPPTSAAARFLGLPKNSLKTYYFKTAGAFFFAFVLHAYGTLIAGGNTMDDVWRYAPQVLLFIIEDQVMSLAKRLGIKGGASAKMVGYMWVFVAEGMTLIWWYRYTSQAGLFAELPPASQKWSPSEWLLAKLV